MVAKKQTRTTPPTSKGRHMKTVTVECTWKSTHEVEVPDDFTDTGSLTDWTVR